MSAAQAQAAVAVVRTMLEAFDTEPETGLELLAPDVEWRNTGLPTLRGRRAHGALLDMARRGIEFEVTFHHIAGTAGERPGEYVVLTDRTDVLGYRRVRTAFQVSGTFVVRDGLVQVWDDHFAWGGFLGGFLRRR